MNQRIDAVQAFLRTPDEPAPFADHRALRARRYDLAAEARREADGARVGIGRAHESAHLHVSGEAAYIDDLPELDGTLHVALGLSPLAHGRITGIDLATLRALPGVLAVLTAADIPGVNDCGPIQHDDPILAELAFDAAGRAAGTVHYLGQPVFAVVATERELGADAHAGGAAAAASRLCRARAARAAASASGEGPESVRRHARHGAGV
jgi:xanthine dehydrogenase large subunit